MLLSMYASYRLARSAMSRRYFLFRLITSGFIVLFSGFSAISPVTYFWFPLSIILFFPLVFPSFPFYSWHDELWLGEPRYWTDFRGIRFLTIDLGSTPSTTYSEYWNFIGFAFSFFLFFNIMGAWLGYWIGKNYRIQNLARWWMKNNFRAIVGVVCLTTGFGLLFIDERVGLALSGFGTILLETIILSKLVTPVLLYIHDK